MMRNHYEVLGVGRDATPAQIKKSFKQLARKYHPDIAQDKAFAHKVFIQITQAYEVLNDPVKRREYDSTLHIDVPQIKAKPETTRKDVSLVTQKIREAQLAFIAKRFHEAAGICREAIKLDPFNPRAHSVLGDIYRAQGKIEKAIERYSYALQFNPHDRETEKKLLDIVGKQVEAKIDVALAGSHPARRMILNILGWGAVLFLIFLIAKYPGPAIPILKTYVPRVQSWSWNLVGFMAGASAISGLMLSVNGLVRHPDDELVFETSGGWAIIPAGLILMIGSAFFFPGVAALYLAIGFAQNGVSRSVLTVFGTIAIVVLLSALMYSARDFRSVAIFGGNVAFLSCLIGWYIGAMMKPLDEY